MCLTNVDTVFNISGKREASVSYFFGKLISHSFRAKMQSQHFLILLVYSTKYCKIGNTMHYERFKIVS